MSKKKIILILIFLFALFFIIPMTTTIGIHSYYFGGRTEYENTYYEYLTSKNSDFTREEITFDSYDNELTGFFYSQKNVTEYKALLVWVHGMNVSHENYMSEYNYLTSLGYLIFAYDNTGVNYSEGSRLKGLSQSPLDLQVALNCLYDLEKYNDLKTILIGHSWGGFSVCAVNELELKKEVDGIISLSGFWKNINVVIDIGEYYVGGIVNLLKPYLILYEKILFNEYSSINGIDGLKNTSCDVLIVQSKDDVIVQYENNYLVYKEEFKNENRFTFIEYDDFGHNITIEKDAYDRIHDIMHYEYTPELDLERNQLIEKLNYTVLNDIINFLNNVIL